MGVYFETGYTIATGGTSEALLDESGDPLLDESGNELLSSGGTGTADQPLGHARIAHSGNWLTGGTVAASSTATGYFADGPNNSLTYEKWQANGSTFATWAYTHTGAAECDYCVIAAHNLGTASVTVDVQAEISATWTTLVSFTPTDDEPIMALFEPRTQTKWRLRLVYSGDEPTIGVIKFGKALQMERPIYNEYTVPNFARQTILRSTYSESGEFLGRTKQRTYLEIPLRWSIISRSWADTNWYPAIKAMESEPFFIAPIPDSRDDVIFGQTTGALPAPAETASGYMSLQVDVRGYGFD